MKKTYIQPEIEMIEVQSESMLAASENIVFDPENENIDNRSNEYEIPSFDIWED